MVIDQKESFMWYNNLRVPNEQFLEKMIHIRDTEKKV